MVTDYEDADVIYEEASTLGWPAGSWPSSFVYDGRMMYRQRTEVSVAGDLLYVEYACDCYRLRVLND